VGAENNEVVFTLWSFVTLTTKGLVAWVVAPAIAIVLIAIAFRIVGWRYFKKG
jgi:hypothetical protein